jgi:RimJ/RimL family protein N-acetyltransferase
VEIGRIVAAGRRGQGIATEATLAVADDALARPRLDHLVAYGRPGNAASLCVCAKLGMRPRGEGRSRSGDPVTILERRR